MTSIDIPKEMWALLDKQPLVAPPPGIIPDLENPTWHGYSVVLAASISYPVMLVVASMRVYTKCYITRRWASDDNIFLISLAAAIIFMALGVALTCGGAYGYHAWDVRIGQLTKNVLMRSFVLAMLSGPLVWLIKLSIFSLLFHAFRPLVYIRRLVYVGVLISGLYHIAVAITTGIICGPHGGHDRASYLAGMAAYKCGDPAGIIQILSVTSGVVNLSTDIYLLILPLRAISKLNLPKRRKTGVMLMFMTGTVGCVMSALALYYRIRTYGGDATMWNSDVTYTNKLIMTVSIVESAVGVMIPCMASCAQVYKHTSGSVTSFVSSRLTGFRRTASIDGSHEGSSELKDDQKPQEQSHTDTIDRMLLQFRPT